jgi:uncharacterized phage protein (TIGR01671 family)
MNNRPLKFRVWDTRYNSFLEERWNSISFLTKDGNGWRDIGAFLDRQTFIVQQFTGLLDTNSRKIFEGDIIKVSDLGTIQIGQVVFLNGEFGINTRNRLRFFDAGGFIREIEIIGNIFENPELLK